MAVTHNMTLMPKDRSLTPLHETLKEAGLRPTRQRLALARLLFDGPNRHISAESLHNEAIQAKLPVSLATVYNTLHQFTRAGLLREVVVEAGRSYFDTNTSAHHHFYMVDDGTLVDVPGDEVEIARLPQVPNGQTLDSVEVILRVRRAGTR